MPNTNVVKIIETGRAAAFGKRGIRRQRTRARPSMMTIRNRARAKGARMPLRNQTSTPTMITAMSTVAVRAEW